MSKGTLQSIRTQSDKLHNRWTREFAGKPRHTRDLAALDKLVEKAQALARKAKQIPGEKGDELEKVVRERLTLYATERGAIAEVKFERPEVAEIHALGLVVDRTLAAWRRHFAGRDRRTRDAQLLETLVQRLSKAVARLGELGPQNTDVVKVESLDSIRGQLEVMKDERSEIDKLRRAMPEADRTSVALAEAAAAMDRYRVLLGGQPRASCSLAHLDAILQTMRRVQAELSKPEVAEAQAQNLAVITQNLEAYEAERPRIEQALAETAPRERGGQLAAVANRLFQVYQQSFAGQSRATRDLKLLSDICDRLTDVAEQMVELDRVHDEPLTRKNVPVVDDRLRRYEAEWLEIAKAKTAAAQKAATPAAPAGRGGAPANAPAPGPQIKIEPKKT
ncbi:MAG: hypothetical protein U1F43_00680 [Myxococcota bacterium]